jgi:hypothetical protein
MALPKIDLPLNTITLPSDDSKVLYRPFTVKEEKILLVAAESRDPLVEMVAIKQVVNNCLFDKPIEEISMLDLEYIFLKLRSTAVNNTAEFTITDPDTNETIPLTFDIEDMEIKRDPTHSKEIRINDDLVLYLKYPNIDDFTKIVGMEPTDPLVNYVIMVACLDTLATEDEVFKFNDYSDEEIGDFMDNLTGDTIKRISAFFETMPKLRQEIKYTNSNDEEKTFVVEGMRSFFT